MAVRNGTLLEPDPYMDLPQVIESCFLLYRRSQITSDEELGRVVGFVHKATDMLFGLQGQVGK